MKTDWIGYWYVASKKRGQNDLMTFINTDAETGKNFVTHIPHSITDGKGAFCNILKSFDVSKIVTGNKSQVTRPPLLHVFRILLKALKNMQTNQPDWIVFDRSNKKNKNSSIQYLHFSEKETEDIFSSLSEKNISLNTWLLTNFKNEILNMMISGDKLGKILIPVDMRQGLQAEMHQKNCSSGVYVELDRNDDYTSVRSKLKDCLTDQIHWGNWWLANIGRLVGKRGVDYLSKRSAERSHYLGTYSNMGVWEYETQEKLKKLPTNIWSFSAPGSANYPLFLGVIVVNGELTVSLKFNKYVTGDQIQSKILVENFRQQLIGYK